VQQPRLVASDVDGTLLATLEPSARTIATVANVLASGTPFVLVTGRPPRWIPPIADHLPGLGTAVCANGAVLYDIPTDRVLSATTLQPALLSELARTCSRLLPAAWLAVERVGRGAFDDIEGQFLCEVDVRLRRPEAYKSVWSSSQHTAVPREQLLDAPAIKLLVKDPSRSSDELSAILTPALGGTVDLTFASSNGLVEMAPAGVTKATGLAEVAASAGVAQADVIAFGDMPNDVDMLRWAGHGVAMGNAHPDVLAVADEVTARNTDDGVALVLERWF
jgi:Cof subfamily protein (haloacid dehalogenase superfamily)